jgi:hypothetical protein
MRGRRRAAVASAASRTKKCRTDAGGRCPRVLPRPDRVAPTCRYVLARQARRRAHNACATRAGGMWQHR